MEWHATRDGTTMCDAISGGGSMPPMKTATTPPATPAAEQTAVQGASGGGSTMPASAVGVGDLSGILAQLTEAVSLLGKLVASMQGGTTVGGGGPIQVPPGKIIGGGVQVSSPLDAIDGRIAKLLSDSTMNSEARTVLSRLRSEVAAERTAAASNGTINQVALFRLAVSVDRAVLPMGDARAARLDRLRDSLQALEADAKRTGSVNQLQIQQLAYEHEQVMKSGAPLPG